MVWRYSGVDGGPVWLDRSDYDERPAKPCAECGKADAPYGDGHGGDEAFCKRCYYKVFGINGG